MRKLWLLVLFLFVIAWFYATMDRSSPLAPARIVTLANVDAAPGLFADGFESSVCPAGRQTTATVCYNYSLGSSCRTLPVTNFDNVWGRNGPNTAPIPFPGYQEFAVFKTLDRTKYLALQIDVPLGLPPLQSGIITHGETYPGPALDVAISSRCGDFTSGSSICRTQATNGGQIAAKWKLPTAIQTNGCALLPGRSYYLNIRAHDSSQASPDCTGNSCKVTVQSNHTP